MGEFPLYFCCWDRGEIANVGDSVNILILIIVSMMTVWFKICNRQADQGKRVIEGAPDFRYTL